MTNLCKIIPWTSRYLVMEYVWEFFLFKLCTENSTIYDLDQNDIRKVCSFNSKIFSIFDIDW